MLISVGFNVKSYFLEPSRDTKIGLRNWEFEKSYIELGGNPRETFGLSYRNVCEIGVWEMGISLRL